MNAMELAVQRKQNAIEHYKRAARDCDHPSGHQMFLVVLAEEMQHLEALEKMLKNADTDLSGLGDLENLATIMESLRARTVTGAACSLDDMEAFKFVMDMEREDYDFYKELAAMTSDEKEKALFEELADDEEKHFEVMSETHSFLTDTGNWFMWDDHSIVEG
jgi:rubrerythrin